MEARTSWQIYEEGRRWKKFSGCKYNKIPNPKYCSCFEMEVILKYRNRYRFAGFISGKK